MKTNYENAIRETRKRIPNKTEAEYWLRDEDQKSWRRFIFEMICSICEHNVK